MIKLFSTFLFLMTLASPCLVYAMGTPAQEPTAEDESAFVAALTPAQTLSLLNEHRDNGTTAQITTDQMAVAAEHALSVGDALSAYHWFNALSVNENLSILDRADLAIASGEFGRASELATLVLNSAQSNSREVISAQFVVRQAAEELQVSPNVVVLLLPLSGKFGAVGKMVEQALLASKPEDASFSYVSLDTSDTVEGAIAAVEAAVFEHQAIAAIGPLRTDFGVDVALAAENLRLPLLALSKSVAAKDYKNWVYQTRLTIQDETEALLQEVMDKKQLKNFAIFSPDNEYGATASAAFLAGVQARGGTVTVHTKYDATAKDMIPFAQVFSRKDYERDAAVFYRMKRKAKKEGKDTQTMVLPPLIDFDAIFVPDNHARLPIALSGLAYEEVPMGRYRPGKQKLSIPLLGLSTWNHPKLALTGGAYVRDSIFVDVYNPRAEGTVTYIDAFKRQHKRTPSVLEAASHDVGVVTAHVIATKPTTRSAFTANLEHLKINPTLTGITGVISNKRALKHKALVLTVGDDGIMHVPATPLVVE